MNQAANWIERFGISDEDLAHLVAESGEKNPLRWCLLNDRISEQEYVQWAMEAYQMPSVGREFFTSPVDSSFWGRVKDLNTWSADLFPLAEWEGVLLIACVEPPQDFYFRHPHRFVLAGARSLALHWNKLNPKPVAAPPSMTLSEPIKEAPLSMGAPVSVSDFDFEPVVEAESHHASLHDDESAIDLSAAGRPMPTIDIPEGFSFDATVKNPSASAAAPESLLPTFPEEPLAAASLEKPLADAELPNGFTETNIANFDFDFTGELLTTPATTPEPKPKPEPRPDPKPAVEAKHIPISVPTASALVSDFALEPVIEKPAPVEAPKPFFASFGGPATPPVPEPVKPAPPVETPKPFFASFGGPATPPPPPPQPKAHAEVEPREEQTSTSTITLAQMELRTVETCVSLDDLGAVAMIHTLRIFNGAMVMLYQGAELKPWKWSDQLTSDRNKALKVELETPSIFKIVYKTRLPYHGYVAPSPTNSTFFNAFHNGTLPAHVTLVPIVIDEEFVGMIMGVSNVEISYKESLKQMERLSEDFGNRLAKLRTANAA